MSDVKEDIGKAERDVWEKALDYGVWSPAVVAAVVGRAIGRRAGKKDVAEFLKDPQGFAKRNKLDRSEWAELRSERGQRNYVRKSGYGGAVGFGAFGVGPGLGYHSAKSVSERKNRK